MMAVVEMLITDLSIQRLRSVELYKGLIMQRLRGKDSAMNERDDSQLEEVLQ
jgi:hypothetical protein